MLLLLLLLLFSFFEAVLEDRLFQIGVPAEVDRVPFGEIEGVCDGLGDRGAVDSPGGGEEGVEVDEGRRRR